MHGKTYNKTCTKRRISLHTLSLHISSLIRAFTNRMYLLQSLGLTKRLVRRAKTHVNLPTVHSDKAKKNNVCFRFLLKIHLGSVGRVLFLKLFYLFFMFSTLNNEVTFVVDCLLLSGGGLCCKQTSRMLIPFANGLRTLTAPSMWEHFCMRIESIEAIVQSRTPPNAC